MTEQRQEFTQARGRVVLGALPRLALALNGFAFVVVNFWIYRARSLFRAAYPDWNGGEPPTISRAISAPEIGQPFAIWITGAGLCLLAGVGLLILCYLRIYRTGPAPRLGTTLAFLGLAPAILVMQAAAVLGMHWLSVYRFPFANQMHMTGSYLFFVMQALVILTFAVFNALLLRDRAFLSQLCERGLLLRRWVVIRLAASVFAIALAISYFVLFIAKDAYDFADNPMIYNIYTGVEPAVISMFLVVLMLAHADLFQRR